MPNQNFYHLENSDNSSQVEITKGLNSNKIKSDSKLQSVNFSRDDSSLEQSFISDEAESRVWQGIKLEQENKLSQAIEYYRQAVQLNSQSAVAHHILAIALKKQNNLIEADYYHRLALSIGQSNSTGHDKITAQNSTNKIKDRSEYLSLRSSSTMVATQSKIGNSIENNPASSTTSTSTIVLPRLTAVAPGTYVESNQLEVTKIYLQQAQLYYSDARWQDSINACEEALKICLDLPEIYKIYGNSLQQMGKFPEAMGYYAKALSKDPYLAEVYANIGSLYAKQNNWQEAINYYQKALNIDPKQAKICLHLSRAWERIGEDERALNALFQALSLQPEILTVSQYIQLADDLLAEDKTKLAISCYEHGVKRQPLSKILYLKLIKVLEQDGQSNEAASYRQIIANLPENDSLPAAKKLRIQRLLDSTATKFLLPVNAAENTNSDETPRYAKRYPLGRRQAQRKDLSASDAHQESDRSSASFKSQQQLKPNVKESQKLLSHSNKEESLTVEQYLEELTKQPNSSTIRLNLANLYARQQRWQEAVSYYQQAIKIEPDLAIAHLRLGKICGILGKHLEGAEFIYRAYSIEPEMGTPEQHYKLGEFWLGQHKGKVAMSCYRRAIELKPGFQAAYSRLKQLIALETQLIAKLTEGKATKQEVAEDSVDQDREFYQQAIAAAKVNNWQQAAQCYQQAIKINPQQYRYYYNLGEVQVKLDQWQAALKCYQKAAELEPNNADIQHNLGEVYSHETSWENAAAAYKKAIALDSKNSWTYHNLGYALLQLQQWQSAADYFTQAISFKADFVWSHYNLGEALSNLEQWDEALAAYQSAREIDPDLSEAKIKIGSILYQRSQQSQQKALSFCKNQIEQDPDNVELYHQAISLDKKDPELYIGLGKALVKQGKIDEAISIYQIGLQIQPRNPELIQGFDRLRTQKIAPSSSDITAKVDNIVNSALSSQEKIQDDLLQLPSHPSPVVSIVIPVYNQIDYTFKCLRSIAELSTEAKIEVIVVNDGSTDNTAETLDRVRGLKRIDNQENLGFLHSCNRGVKAASGEYIYFLNNDTELRPQALEHLLSVFKDPEVGAVGSKLIYPDGSLQEAGGIVFQNASAWNYGTKENTSAPQYNYLRPVDYCSGASLLVKRTVFKALDGFDINLSPAYYEDTDLCFAIRHQLKLKVIYQPKSEVIHHEGISCGTQLDSPIKRYQSINQAKFAAKWATELASYPDDASQAGIAAASRRHSGKKTILVVDLYAPCYDKESGARRIWELLQILKQLNYHVIFLPDSGVKEQPYVEMLQDSSIEVIYHESEYEKGVEQQLEELLPLVDLAWVCRPQLYEKYAPLIRQYQQIKLVYDTVDLHYLRLQRAAKFEDSGIQGMRQWVRMQVKELKAAHEADLTITVTPIEKQILEQQRVQNLAVVPNIHPTSTVEKTGFNKRSGLLFIGSYNHPPNVDAVGWLVREIMPLVWQQIPDLTVTLLGSNPSAEVTALGRDGRIAVTGYVPDVTPYFLSHRVFVAPLRYGAGMKGKIGQSLEYGLPVVSTEIGLEGMGLVNEENILSANQSQEFGSQIIRLYSQEQLWNQLASNSEKAIASFTPDVVRQQVQQALNSLLTEEFE